VAELEGTSTDPKDEDPQDPPADGEESLPEWARNSITRANNEAAAKRVELQNLREEIKNMKSLEEVDALVADLETKAAAAELAVARERAGRKYGLPDELVERLQGADEAELLADAEKLRALLKPGTPPPPAPPAPSGGRTPHRGPADYDPEEEYQKAKRLL
jgi:hypothetical protein